MTETILCRTTDRQTSPIAPAHVCCPMLCFTLTGTPPCVVPPCRPNHGFRASLPPASTPARDAGASAGGRVGAGSRSSTSLPRSGRLLTRTSPPCARATARTSASPRPVPRGCPLSPPRNLSKMCPSNSAGMPWPANAKIAIRLMAEKTAHTASSNAGLKGQLSLMANLPSPEMRSAMPPSVVGELVAFTAHRLDQAEAKLRPQARHVQGQAPGPDDLRTELTGPERIAAQVGVLAQPDPYPGQQLRQRERLGQVILRAALQAVDLRGHIGHA